MALPNGRSNMVGVLVTSASANTLAVPPTSPAGELNIQVGTVIATSSSVTSNNIAVPVPTTALILFQMSASGTVKVVADTAASGVTPTFVSANAQTVQTNNSSTLQAILINTSASEDNVAIKITNLSGGNLTVADLGMLVLVQLKEQDDFGQGRGNAMDCVLGRQDPRSSNGVQGNGTYNLTDL